MRHSSICPVRITGKMLRCCYCNETFDDPLLFRSHVNQKHSSIDKASCLKKLGNRQMRVDISDLSCVLCSKPFASLEQLAEHLIADHKFEIDTQISLGVVPLHLEKNNHKCVVCNQKFTGLMPLSRHTGTHFYQHICDICGQRCETYSGIRNHIERHHSHKHMCRVCKKPFPSAQAKIEHIKSNSTCLPYSCKLCKERFLFFELRQQHLLQVHDVPKPEYRCTECDAVFEKRMKLYLHFKSEHTEEHKCSYCENRFGTRRSLIEHERGHTGQRPLVCEVCDKSFARKKSYIFHLLIHDDSKKLKCPVCCRKFIGTSKLKAHMKKHHPEAYLKKFPEKSTT